MAHHDGKTRRLRRPKRLLRCGFRNRRRRPENRFETARGTIEKESARVVWNIHPKISSASDGIVGNKMSGLSTGMLASELVGKR